MIIIVPNAVDGLSSLVEGLVNYTLADLRNREKFGTIRVLLPKFKIESTATLNKPLEQVLFPFTRFPNIFDFSFFFFCFSLSQIIFYFRWE